MSSSQTRASPNSQEEQEQLQLQATNKQTIDIDALLSKPTWSVRSLLPPATPTPSNNSSSTSTPSSATAPATPQTAPSISPSQFHHLLRLSALPPPQSAAEEQQMLQTLATQLHFVREIQSVDTTGVLPLQAIRDETAAGVAERTIGLDALRAALDDETIVGRNRRPRRRRRDAVETTAEREDWDRLGMAEDKVGRYFVVRSGKGME
ncbi:MAG: hypothetical protein M1818_005810 [Claussenomyces sp. TS43310]|nr:MAG: hypothetical protein M1818_005810 [Claussenomyces sp. TS43310]